MKGSSLGLSGEDWYPSGSDGKAPKGPSGVRETAWYQGHLSKAGKGSMPAWSTRERQGRSYKRIPRNREVASSSADRVVVLMTWRTMVRPLPRPRLGRTTAGEESTRGRPMVPAVVARVSARGPRPRRATRRSEPTRGSWAYRRVPLSLGPDEADSERSGRLKPDRGKPAVRNFRGPCSL